MQVSDYISLIPSQNASAPKFVAMVSLLAQAFVDEQTTLGAITFDLDTAAGVSLDAIGQWVGITRQIQGPPLQVYFSFDVVGLGFDQGLIYGPSASSAGVSTLDDYSYRTLLRIKIAANSWDGTLTGFQNILAMLVNSAPPIANQVVDVYGDIVQSNSIPVVQIPIPGSYIGVFDNQDMTMTIALAGIMPTAVTTQLLTSIYTPLKPEGVKLKTYATSISGSPIFGFDCENGLISGFDAGSIAVPF